MKKITFLFTMLIVIIVNFPAQAGAFSDPKNDSIWFAPYLNLDAYTESKRECIKQITYIREKTITDKKLFLLDGNWKDAYAWLCYADRLNAVSRKVTIQFVHDIPAMNRGVTAHKDSIGGYFSGTNFFINPDSVEKYCDMVYLMAVRIVLEGGLGDDEIKMIRKGKGKAHFFEKEKYSPEELFCMQWQLRYVLEEKLKIWKTGEKFTKQKYLEVQSHKDKLSSGAREYFKVMNPEVVCEIFSSF